VLIIISKVVIYKVKQTYSSQVSNCREYYPVSSTKAYFLLFIAILANSFFLRITQDLVHATISVI